MLIAICGKSGSGKSTIVKELEELGFKRVVTDTTRPPRKGEVNEVDYYFDTEEQFMELLEEGEFVETTAYKVATGDLYRYGTTRGAIAEAGEKAVIVLNPMGLKTLREKQIDMIVIYIDCNESVLLSRLKERGDFKNEIIRRMDTDNRDFEDIHNLIDGTVYNEKNTDIKKLAKTIIDLAEQIEENRKNA